MGEWQSALEGVVMFSGAFDGKKVLVTGHTGFKGVWLCAWLRRLGADVTGVALPPHTDPAMFTVLGLSDDMRSEYVDIRDFDALNAVVSSVQPDVVIHMAAQALVRLSYAEPKMNWDTNVGGTVNVLETVRLSESVRACVVVSSDKCYENREQIWGYRESDPMGGHDPYSASKGATELVATSYRKSFFGAGQGCRLASARAGNVIGGGDWAGDRIVTDFVKACARGDSLHLRNPTATRPWQHVLEPLSGYLTLAANLLDPSTPSLVEEGWNFGPADSSVTTVRELARHLAAAWGGDVKVTEATAVNGPHEAGLLHLDVTKAATYLNWKGAWNVAQTVDKTVEWYKAFYAGDEDMAAVTDRQITEYENKAQEMGIQWAVS